MKNQIQFLIYNTPQETAKIDVVAKDETIWLTQKGMAALFEVQVPAINKHLKNIFEEGELDEKVIVSKMEITTAHGAMAENNTFTMEEFSASVNAFLVFRKYEILNDKGNISKREADDKAEAEYDGFTKTQRIISDFDKEIEKLIE